MQRSADRAGPPPARQAGRLASAAMIALIGVFAVGCNRTGAAAPVNAAPANAVPAALTATAVATTVPFVGCAQDGQGGPQPAPTGPPKTVVMDPAAAARLAYYSAGNGGVLGPRGWFCFGAYGSDGAVLYLAPAQIKSADVLSDVWAAGAGPAIEAAVSTGDTSGRFTVAQIIERVFPTHRAFAQSVISEGIEPPTQFPPGPFPTDRTVSKSDTVVEYETPAGAQGLGTTFSRLTPDASPIDGAAVLQGQTPDLAFLAVRLTPDLQGLAPAIVQQFEADSAAPAPAASAQAQPAPAANPPAADASSGQASLPDVAPAGDATAPIGVVRAFYTALGNGDGVTASTLVEPQKRGGNYAPAALSRYYGGMSQALQLLAAQQTGPGAVFVRYSFVAPGGRACNGAANVHTVEIGGQNFISSIQALNGC
jgi:hypothetical protein